MSNINDEEFEKNPHAASLFGAMKSMGYTQGESEIYPSQSIEVYGLGSTDMRVYQFEKCISVDLIITYTTMVFLADLKLDYGKTHKLITTNVDSFIGSVRAEEYYMTSQKNVENKHIIKMFHFQHSR